MKFSAPSRAASGSPGFLKRSQPRYGEKAVKGLLVAASLVSVLTTVGIVVALIPPAVEFFGKVGFGEFITGTNWSPLFKPAHFGVIPLVTATLLVTLIALLVAVPLGLGAAIYLSEYANPRVRSIFNVNDGQSNGLWSMHDLRGASIDFMECGPQNFMTTNNDAQGFLQC